MDKITRNLAIIGISVVAIFILSMFIKNSPATDTTIVAVATQELPIERMVHIQATITADQTSGYEKARSALVASRWSDFWMYFGQMIILSGLVALLIFAYKSIPVVVDALKKRLSVVQTAHGAVSLQYDDNGTLMPISLENLDKAIGRAVIYNDRGREKVVFEQAPNNAIETVPTPDIYADAALFLEQAILVAGEESKMLPRHDKMGVGGERWNRMVHEVFKGMFSIEHTDQGIRTLCSEMPDLHAMYIAVKRRRIPLPR